MATNKPRQGHLPRLRSVSRRWWKHRFEFRPHSLHHCPYFLRDDFTDGRFNHVAMDRLQFGRH